MARRGEAGALMSERKDWDPKFYSTQVWREIRRQQLEWADYCCQGCGRHSLTGEGLEIHHNTYERFGGNERIGRDLIVLCATGYGCEGHDYFTNYMRQRRNNKKPLAAVPGVPTQFLSKPELKPFETPVLTSEKRRPTNGVEIPSFQDYGLPTFADAQRPVVRSDEQLREGSEEAHR